jgi:hypothetical protein
MPFAAKRNEKRIRGRKGRSEGKLEMRSYRREAKPKLHPKSEKSGSVFRMTKYFLEGFGGGAERHWESPNSLTDICHKNTRSIFTHAGIAF